MKDTGKVTYQGLIDHYKQLKELGVLEEKEYERCLIHTEQLKERQIIPFR